LSFENIWGGGPPGRMGTMPLCVVIFCWHWRYIWSDFEMRLFHQLFISVRT